MPTRDLPIESASLLAHYQPRVGWNHDTLLLHALNYIQQQDDDRVFLEYLETIATEEAQFGLTPDERLVWLQQLLSERLQPELPAGTEILIAPSDNGEPDWEQPVHVTAFLPDGTDAYGLADLASDTLEAVTWYLIDQVREGIAVYRARHATPA